MTWSTKLTSREDKIKGKQIHVENICKAFQFSLTCHAVWKVIQMHYSPQNELRWRSQKAISTPRRCVCSGHITHTYNVNSTNQTFNGRIIIWHSMKYVRIISLDFLVIYRMCKVIGNTESLYTERFFRWNLQCQNYMKGTENDAELSRASEIWSNVL
jgi:hypothetical protein